jgi:hypothetical protein
MQRCWIATCFSSLNSVHLFSLLFCIFIHLGDFFFIWRRRCGKEFCFIHCTFGASVLSLGMRWKSLKFFEDSLMVKSFALRIFFFWWGIIWNWCGIGGFKKGIGIGVPLVRYTYYQWNFFNGTPVPYQWYTYTVPYRVVPYQYRKNRPQVVFWV